VAECNYDPSQHKNKTEQYVGRNVVRNLTRLCMYVASLRFCSRCSRSAYANFITCKSPSTTELTFHVCKTVRPMLLGLCLSVCPVCDVGVLWPNGWMEQHATWYGGRPLSWPHCVRWGPSSPNGAQRPPIFDPCLLWPNGLMDQDAA